MGDKPLPVSTTNLKTVGRVNGGRVDDVLDGDDVDDESESSHTKNHRTNKELKRQPMSDGVPNRSKHQTTTKHAPDNVGTR